MDPSFITFLSPPAGSKETATTPTPVNMTCNQPQGDKYRGAASQESGDQELEVHDTEGFDEFETDEGYETDGGYETDEGCGSDHEYDEDYAQHYLGVNEYEEDIFGEYDDSDPENDVAEYSESEDWEEGANLLQSKTRYRRDGNIYHNQVVYPASFKGLS